MHKNKDKTLAQCQHDRTAYAMNPEKSQERELISAYECDPQTMESEFLLSKREYGILTGRQQKNDVIVYQIRQSYKPEEATPEEANRIRYELASRFQKGKYPFIVCTHTDKAHSHNHIIWDLVSFNHKRKLRDFFRSGRAVRRLSDQICTEHHLSVIQNPTVKGKPYNVWLGQELKLSLRELLRRAIDDALAKHPASFEEMLSLLTAAGCEIKPRKNPSIRFGAEHRFARFDMLGRGYFAEELRAIIVGAKKAPQCKRPRSRELTARRYSGSYEAGKRPRLLKCTPCQGQF